MEVVLGGLGVGGEHEGVVEARTDVVDWVRWVVVVCMEAPPGLLPPVAEVHCVAHYIVDLPKCRAPAMERWWW